MCSQTRRSYYCDWYAPGRARAVCADHLAAVLGHDGKAESVVSDSAIVVSELVTNAVNAGCSSVDVTVMLHRDHLRIVVADDGPGQPQLRDAGPADENGRGLQVVDSLARSWGVSALDNGKQVWAVLGVPTSLTSGMDCKVATLL